MAGKGCRNENGEIAYGDNLVIHNHVKDLGAGDLIVHGANSRGLWIGIKKEDNRVPTWFYMNLDEAVDLAAALMWAAQFKE